MREHRIEDLIQLFNGLFREPCNTILVAGEGEPLYRPADHRFPHHRIIFAHGFYASALHEIAHWCVAGPQRRQLEDYGYWYKPDGRSPAEQAEFERVEVKPQAYEWLFSAAADHPFHFSADNIAGGCGPSPDFRQKVRERAQQLLAHGMPDRPKILVAALCDFYDTRPDSLASHISAGTGKVTQPA
ncbi:MAG: elongation factor P hydroxylase [Natronospirillum sp.]|uniref:elongation factor P hydroxylase n=1 Tax=Natronospirillum sp. TaxID=2812955 RepID=UPI0025FB9AD9|nr:elongation factor P hydroxylase [Natronospirillum sp.]MCH8552012.1 elongation factor P hydroxylase [Natronospirillum sp.]